MPFNFRELKKDEEVICLYVGYLKNVGVFKKPVFVFQSENKKQFHLWGTVLLSAGMYGVPFRTKLKIKYQGMIAGTTTSRLLKGYQIEVLEDEKVKPHTKRKKKRPRADLRPTSGYAHFNRKIKRIKLRA